MLRNKTLRYSLVVALVLIFGAVVIYLRIQNQELTETQFFLRFWYVFVPGVVLLFAAYKYLIDRDWK